MDRKTDWHRASWLRCMEVGLPELIATRVEVSTYRIVDRGDLADIEVGVLSGTIEIRTTYCDIPMPDDSGLFASFDPPRLVVPVVEDETMAVVRCAGDQLLGLLEARLVDVAPGLLTTEEALRNWLPLSDWIGVFLDKTGQILDNRNWVSRETHLRRIIRENPADLFADSRMVCPFEQPEGPRLGHVLSLAAGARIEDGRVVASDGMPAIGLAASYIPFIDKNDPARLLMGSNMMRQWIEPTENEAAMVQTGTEPAERAFWCGFNLLTAFMALGRETFEDGIVVSESAAQRMAYPEGIAVGDKLSNRHGQKGLVSRIRPDDQMPRLSDGTAVECVVSFIGLHTRQNTGQLWEAAASWIAKNQEDTYVVPPYQSPGREELSARLASLESPHRRRLRLSDGSETEAEVLVGWVYWGCTVHRAKAKLRAAGAESALQVHGEMEYNALRNNGLFAYIAESNGPASEEASHEETERLVAGSWMPGTDSAFETAPVRRIRNALARAGLEVVADARGLGFRWVREAGHESLPVTLRHPWRSRKTLDSIPPNPDDALCGEVGRRAHRLQLLLDSDAPRSLVDSSTARLQEAADAYFATLITHQDVVPRGRRRFSARAVIVPSSRGGIEDVGIPEEIAWTLFGPLLAGSVDPEGRRTERAREALREAMAERHVIVHRAPTLSDTTMIAFRPRLVAHAAVELHPLVCRWMNADFDGDMVGVYLPVSAAAQQEAASRLTVAGHLRRNPALLDSLVPTHEALFGLAIGGAKQHVGGENDSTPAPTTSSVARELWRVQMSDGPEKAIARVEELFADGLAAARGSGASFDPLGDAFNDHAPDSRSEAAEILSSPADAPGEFQAQLVAIKSGARGTMDQLLNLLHSRVLDTGVVRPGQLAGYTEEDHRLIALEVRRQLHTLITGLSSVAGDYNIAQRPPEYTLLARLARAEEPGVVIASAAESGETDPLTDLDARLTVGLPVAEATGRRTD